MAIKKSPKPPKFKAPKPEKPAGLPDDTAICPVCEKPVKKVDPDNTYVSMSLLDPTEYLHASCYPEFKRLQKEGRSPGGS